MTRFASYIYSQLILLLIALTCTTSTQAAISLSGTRIIFDGNKKESSLIVSNSDAKVLVQSWIESNTPGDTGELSFAITPPLAKMQPNGQQLLRVLYAGGKNDMPTDKESVLWLNIQEIPEEADEESVLQIAVRQRIKLFFRPAGLLSTAEKAPSQLQWQVTSTNGKPAVTVINPSAFHVSMSGIYLGSDSISKAIMIAPGETQNFPLKTSYDVDSGKLLKFEFINDYGGTEKYEAHISGSSAVQGRAIKT